MQSFATVRAFSWDSVSPVAKNITGMVRIYPGANPSQVAQQLNALPAGRRFLCMLGFTERLATNPADQCMKIDARGKVTRTGFFGPWCDAGTVEVKTSVERFLDALKRAGARDIDALVLDNETNFNAGRFISSDGSGANAAAIESDPRFAAIAKRLGFKKLEKLWWGGPQYLRWNEVIQPDFDIALNRAITAPFKSRWPNALVCNYGCTVLQAKYMTPDMSGLGMVYGGKGFGTHNSLSFYGDSLTYIKGRPFAGTTLNNSAFDLFRMNIHRMRAAGASSGRSMLPWIASWSLGLNGEELESDSAVGPNFSAISGSAYWDENVIQLAMHGCDTMLLFNPAAWRRDQNPAIWNKVTDQERCASVIDQINTKLGSTPGVSRWFSLPGLQDRVMATGRRVTGGTMWRFSFAEGVASVTVAMKSGDVREIVPEAGEVGAWVFEADNNPFAAKVDGTDIAYAEAPAGAAWPDLDDSGELDQGDISLLLLDMNEMGSSFDINGDNIVTNADVTAFKTIQKSWYAQATKGRTAMEGSVLVTAAR
jgi:hypothetical protein